MVGLLVKFIGGIFRMGFFRGAYILIFLFCFVYFNSFGNVTIRVANLKQDMELVSRELAGLRTEIELLRRENAQLRIQVEQSTRKRTSSAGDSNQALQIISDRVKSIENRLSQTEKSQSALQKSFEFKMKDLISQMNKGFDQVHSPPSNSPSIPSFDEDYPQKGFVHVVEKGETVSSIAKKYKSQTKWIINANQIVDPKKVFIGKELFVPQN